MFAFIKILFARKNMEKNGKINRDIIVLNVDESVQTKNFNRIKQIA